MILHPHEFGEAELTRSPSIEDGGVLLCEDLHFSVCGPGRL